MNPLSVRPAEPQQLQLTRHAAVRLQQRGIPAWFVELLVEHGASSHDGHGAVVLSVNKVARQRLAKVLDKKAYARAERWFDVYAVVSGDNSVVTAAHRTHRRFH